MSSWVKVGAKCVRVDPFVMKVPPIFRLPPLAEPLTIREVLQHDGELYLRLIEVRNESWVGVEPCFLASRFRPIVDERDDIALFNEIARPAKIDATTEQLERAWRESEHVIADDQSLRWIEEHSK